MNTRRHRHVALLLGALGLLLAVLLAPPAVEPPAFQGRPVEPTSSPAAAAPPTKLLAAADPELEKKAVRALAKAKPPIVAAAASTGGPERFVVRDRNASVFFTPHGIALALQGRREGRNVDATHPGWGLHWGILGAAPVEPRPEGEQAAKVHILKGKPEEWKTDQTCYERIVYDDIKPGIDMIVESRNQGVKYSLIAEKASQVASLRLRYQGATLLRTVDDGRALEIAAGEGQIREDGLVVTQEGRPVHATYRVTGPDEYGIVVEGADPDLPLLVDPVIGWSTYLGGTETAGDGSESGKAIRVDSAGDIYVAGETNSVDYPISGGFDNLLGGYRDGFITKIDGPTRTILWSTFLGGSSYDSIYDIAIDTDLNVYVTGTTESTDFPVTGGVHDTTYSNVDAFVAKIHFEGTSILWATFLGGSSSEQGRAIAVDGPGNQIWVAGYTYSTDFPNTGQFGPANSGAADGFVTKLNATGSTLTYSCHVGGTNYDFLYGMAIGADGSAYVTGYTSSTNFPLAGTPHDSTANGSYDVFVAKLKPTPTSLEWSTYLGGTSTDYGIGIALDSVGACFVTGYTYSTGFPVPLGTWTIHRGGTDAFLSKFSSGGALLWSSFLGGTGYDYGQAVRVDTADDPVITGYSSSTEATLFPIGGTGPPVDSTHNGGYDIFVTKFLGTGGGAWWSTWLGGSSYEYCYGMAMDSANVIYLTGHTSSGAGFPMVAPIDNTLGSYQDAFVIRLSALSDSITFSTYLGGVKAVGDDYGRKVALDPAGNLFVSGITYSSNFPTTGGVLQPSPVGYQDTTLTKYSNLASPTVLWSTYLGGSGYEEPGAVAVDPLTSQPYVVGYTDSFDFPVVASPPLGGYSDVFVTKLTTNGAGLVWSRFFGGSSDEYEARAAVNSFGDIAIGCTSYSFDFLTAPTAFQTVPAGTPDALVAILSADGSTVVYSTYLGGTWSENNIVVAFDPAGTKLHVAGRTDSLNFPLSATPYQSELSGGYDQFVARLNPSALGPSQLEYSTYYGGFGYDYTSGLAVDTAGSMYLVGQAEDASFFTTTGPPFSGYYDVSIVKFLSTGALAWARFLGGSGYEYPAEAKVDAAGSLYVVGETDSNDFPIQGAFQAYQGATDAFVTKIDVGGGSLDWSTYLGGSDYDRGYGIILAGGGAVFVVGETNSANFTTLGSPLPPDGTLNGRDFFVTRIDNSNPTAPSSLAQLKVGGTPIAVAGWSNEASFQARATIGDLDDDNVSLEVEIRPINIAFSNIQTNASAYGSGGIFTFTVPFPGGTQEFHWQARTKDIHGRTSAWVPFGGNSDVVTAARDLGRDIVGPTVATLTPTTGMAYTTATSPISFTGTATDTLSGIASVTWINRRLPALTTIASGNATGLASWSILSIPLEAGAVNQLTITATDNAQNTGTRVITITLDTVAPTVSITTPTNTAPFAFHLTGSNSVLFTGSATDGFSVNAVNWTKAGASGTATFTAGGTPPTNRNWQASIPLSPGDNVISFTSVDGANNVSVAAQRTVRYDNVGPTLTITNPASGPHLVDGSPLALLEGTAIDTNGVPAGGVTWLNVATGLGGTASGTNPWSVTNIGLNALNNLIRVTAVDAVGNSTQTTIMVVSDTASPTISITNPPGPITTADATIVISGSAGDDVQVSSVTWTNAAAPGPPVDAVLTGPATSKTWSTDAPDVVTLANGANLITFTVTDVFGKTASVPITITRDTTVPSIVVATPNTSPFVTTLNPYTVTGTATAGGTKKISALTVRNSTTGVFGTIVPPLPAVPASSAPFSTSLALVEGNNTIVITATDDATPTPLVTVVNITIIYDPTAPVVTITGPTGTSTYATGTPTVALSGVASDNRTVSKVAWVNSTTTGFGDANIVGSATSVDWTIASIPLNPGPNSIVVTVTDGAGTTSTDTITVTFDSTVPGVTITTPTSAPTYTTLSTPITVGGTATDTVGIGSVTWSNAANAASGTASGTTDWSAANVPLAPGANVITVVAHDLAGNTQSDAVTIYLDTAAPTITFTSPVTAPSTYITASGAISPAGTAVDDINVAAITWECVGSLTTTNGTADYSGPAGSTVWSIASIPLDIGSNAITVTISDGISAPVTSAVLTVVYDPTAPSVTIATPSSDPYRTTTTPASLAGTAADLIGAAPGTVAEVRWTNLTTGGSGIAAGGTSWNCLIPLTSGGNSIVVTAVDAAGNTFDDTVMVIYDPAAPIIAITTPTTGISFTTGNTPITIAGTASDDVGVVSVTWSTSAALPLPLVPVSGTTSWTVDVALLPGENVITITAKDAVDRTGTAFLTIIYDPTAPTVTILDPSSDLTFLTTQSPIDVSGIANDNLKLQSVEWSNGATGESGNTQGLGAWSIPSLVLNEGPNLITVTATDGVNNSSNALITINYDGTNPVLAITPPVPPDATPTAVLGTYDTNVRPFPLAGTVSDNQGVAKITWTNSAGGGGEILNPPANWNAAIYLYTGTNVILVTAFDNHGRTATDTLTLLFTPETSAPGILIDAPLAGPSATQVVVFSGTANDVPGVVTVRWKNLTTGVSGLAILSGPAINVNWTANVPLTAGVNVLQATAIDDARNTAAATVNVTYTAPDDTIEPNVSIQLPVDTGLYSSNVSPVTLSMNATDFGGIAAVTWSSSASDGTGGSGFATPGVDPVWTASVALALGTNIITVTAVDPSGNTDTDTIVITFSSTGVDIVPPTLAITSHSTASTLTVSVGQLSLAGTSTDNIAVATVVWSNDATGLTGSAEGTDAWTLDVVLEPGINILTMRSYDTSGLTDSEQLTVLYTPPPPPPEVVPTGSCGLVGLDALALLALLVAWRRRRPA